MQHTVLISNMNISTCTKYFPLTFNLRKNTIGLVHDDRYIDRAGRAHHDAFIILDRTDIEMQCEMTCDTSYYCPTVIFRRSDSRNYLERLLYMVIHN